jgi:hypothetical protein
MRYQVILDSEGNVTVQAGDKSFALSELDGLGLTLVTGTLREALDKVDGKPKPKAKRKRKGKAKYRLTETGQEFSSKSDLGKHLDPGSQWPHKIAQAAIDSGKALEVTA